MLCGVDPECLNAALAEIEQRWGSVDAYLELSAGMTADKCERLKSLMLE